MKIVQQPLLRRGIKPVLVFALIIAGSFTVFHLAGILFPNIPGTWNLRLQDELFRLRYALFGKEETSSYIIHAAITDRTITEKNISLHDRDMYARLIRVLDKAGASRIGYDIFFQDPVGEDNLLAREAVKKKKRLKDAAQLLGIDRFKLNRILHKHKRDKG